MGNENACEIPEQGMGLLDKVNDIKSTLALAQVRKELYQARDAMNEMVSDALYGWTRDWRDAYKTVACCLASDESDIKRFNEENDLAFERVVFGLKTYDGWILELKYRGNGLGENAGVFDYNPLAQGTVDEEVDEWKLEGDSIVAHIDKPFRGETDHYAYKIPMGYFNVLRSEGESAAKKFAYDYALRQYALPHLAHRLQRPIPKDKEGRQREKIDLRVMKQELANAKAAREGMDDTRAEANIAAAIIGLYENEIAALKSRRENDKKQRAKAKSAGKPGKPEKAKKN